MLHMRRERVKKRGIQSVHRVPGFRNESTQHPGMMQCAVCSDCRSSGETVSREDKCGKCKGQKVVREKVHIMKSMRHGQQIMFQGQADEAPDTQTGDIVFILQLEDHPKFKRKGDDLFVKHALSLSEALCGNFQFPLTHLDGRKLLIKSIPGEIIKPGQYKAINDEGMPHYQCPIVKGRLYLQFAVQFPRSGAMTTEQCKAVEVILPPRATSLLTDKELDECEEITLIDVNIEDIARKQQADEDSNDEDEDSSGPHPIQCPTLYCIGLVYWFGLALCFVFSSR